MTQVYLEKLKLKGFRSYKQATEITFPPGPGLTVVVGPNGLGKSTLFDAIEWGLTGELRRLNSMDAKAADRKAALGQKPEIELWFDDEAYIHRNLSKVTIKKPSVVISSIAEWLTAEKWKGVTSIADCLQLTHFLGQSSRQMFVHLDGKQRWDLLEGPAGLQSLWKVESTLGRKQTDIGFERVQLDFTQSEIRTQEKIKQILELQDQLRAKRELERADEILAPVEIIKRCEALGRQLEFEPHEILISPEAFSTSDIDALLNRQRTILGLAEQHLANARTQLTPWTGLAQEYSTSLAKQDHLRGEKDRVAQELNAATARFEAAKQQTAIARVELEAKKESLRTLLNHRTVLRSDIDRNAHISALAEQLQVENQKFDELTTKVDEQGRNINLHRDALALLENQRSRHLELTERNTALKVLVSRAENLRDEITLRHQARLQLSSIPASEAALQDALIEQKQALELLEYAAGTLTHQKAAAIEVGNAIAAGVAQIASALLDKDCICPVCQTTFQQDGKLKELASRQANATNLRLAEVEKKILQQTGEIRDVKQKISDLSVKLDRLNEQRKQLSITVSSVDLLEQTLRNNPILAGTAIDAFLPTLETAIYENEIAVQDLMANISRGPDTISLRNEIQRLSNTQKEITEQRNQAKEKQSLLERDLAQLRNSTSMEKTIDELMAAAAEVELTIPKFQQAASHAHSKTDATQEFEVLMNARMVEKQGQAREVDIQLAFLASTAQELEARWSRQGYENIPLPEIVLRHEEAYENRAARLQRISNEHSSILEGRRRYLAHAEIQQIEAKLRAECERRQAESVDHLLAALAKELSKVKKQKEMLSKVQTKRTQLLNQLRQKATDIRSAVSEPLNANIERFCAALMSDRTHQVSLNAIASATTAQALLSYQPDGQGAPKNPLLYMSEGQLAATSLCLLFGASATYPWSRWKGLLMDDPLHHNDSIHAAAFIDVIRNLIRSQGYQIIVSTHDMEQAGYFLRKCRNAGVTARYLHLYGRAEDGTALIQSA